MRTFFLLGLLLAVSCSDTASVPPDGTTSPDGVTPSDAAAPTDCPPGFTRDGETCVSSGGTTYYVRPDGGTLAQCDGTSDAAYPPASGKACAWKHPFYALPPVNSTLSSPFAGGDLLVIAAGEYAIGAGGIPDSGYASCGAGSAVGYDCVTRPIPSGTAAIPTRIVGAGFDRGCAAPPQLWGTYRTPQVIDLEGSDHVVVACLDVTDHKACTRNHYTAAFACDQDIGVVEGYAYNGIFATDSEDVTLVDLRIHGLDRGILAGRIGDWTLERVQIRGNVAAGFDGDVAGDDHDTGPVTMRDGSISWSGCIERYPAVDDEPVGCVSQDRGGYGDGLGTGATGNDWTFDHFDFHHNVSDGLDLLYLDSATAHVVVNNSHFEGNAGNALKIAGGGHEISNVSVVGNCGFFDQPTKWPDMVNHCRAAGNTFSLGSGGGAAITLSNVSAWSEGDCLVYHEAPLVFVDSVVRGSIDFLSQSENACFTYSDAAPQPSVTATNLVAFGFKNSGGCDKAIDASGTVGSCVDPMFVAGSEHSSAADPTYTFDLRLSPTSPFTGFTPPLGASF